ncbi:protein LDOC1-like [Pleurodeles waltl]|uniref:protein LDOC1-like n=1 Tax=Pleurodeles waltl TaxID=8319 RepID=UPI00370937D9
MDIPPDDVMETAQSMLHTIQQQTQELQLCTENTALRQALVSRSSDVPAISVSTPLYSGDPNNLKEFRDSLMVYFAFRPSQFTQDTTKIGYLISSLSGTALAWATPLVAANDQIISNYSDFLQAFKQMFE